MEKAPVKLREAEPAPNLTTSDNPGVLMSSSNALAVVSPSAANPEAEKPSPLPLTWGFLDSILAFRVPGREKLGRWLPAFSSLSCSFCDGDLRFIWIRFFGNALLNATVL